MEKLNEVTGTNSIKTFVPGYAGRPGTSMEEVIDTHSRLLAELECSSHLYSNPEVLFDYLIKLEKILINEGLL